MGFNAPSKIQETALPILLADPPQNMIAQSQSGTGKTAAFVLAMLSRVDTKLDYPQVYIGIFSLFLFLPFSLYLANFTLNSQTIYYPPLSQILCLSPTYELAIQTGEAAARMAQYCPNIKLKLAVRGEEGKLYFI